MIRTTGSKLALVCVCIWPAVGLAQDVSPSKRIAAVEFPDGASGAAAPIPDPRLDQVNAVFLPVLIPSDFLRYKSFAFVGEPLHYSASIRRFNTKESFSGTRLASDVPGSGVDGGGDVVTTTFGERSVSAGTVRFGAAYLATIECRRDDDKRCQDPSYAERLLASAVFVGGARGTPPPLADSGAAAPLPPATPFDSRFAFNQPGELVHQSGDGVRSNVVHAPNIRFPLKVGPAYLNSQVYGIGGQFGPRGSWKDARNYAYPWRDNFCERRSRRTPACPSGAGHQGVDIRPRDARDAVHSAVAAEDGRIADVGLYTVTLAGASGTTYRYLHLKMARLAVKQGERVTRGQAIGLVSSDFGGTPTPVHLHFEMLQNVGGRGLRHVPPYMSLVRAYQQGS